MNRRHFLRAMALSGATFSILPQIAFQELNKDLSYDELIGKGNPKLFGDGLKLRKEAYSAFLHLSTKAQESDISIKAVSSYRGFEHQNQIWKRKYKRYIGMGLSPEKAIKKIIEYSTIPGTSRHHWGADIDLIDSSVKQPKNVFNLRHYQTDGCYFKFKNWMDDNAKNFGFHLVYTNIDDRKGFKYEPWHYSYKPLAKVFLDQYKSLNIKDIITSENIMGSVHFTDAFIETYRNENILDINPELL